MVVAAESLLAWVGFPLVFGLVALGLGLLAERALGMRLPVPVACGGGAAIATVVPFTLYKLFGGVVDLAIALLLAGAIAGLVLGRGDLRERLRPGPAGLAALGGYLLVLAPVLLSGRWTWTGYNFVNDTAIQLMLADWLPHHGFVQPGYTYSTRTAVLTAYVSTAYPAGSHTLLGTLAPIIRVPLAAAYQPYLGAWVALLAASLTQVARLARAPRGWALAAGLGAAGANLLYQYALQGNVKEMAFAAFLAAATAAGAFALTVEEPARPVAVCGACAGAGFLCYSTAGLPSLAALAGALVLALVLRRGRAPARRLLAAGLVGVLAAAVVAGPAIGAASRFTTVARANFGSTDRAADIGQLVRPLPRIQAAGVWLTGDYRFPVVGRWRVPNGVLAAWVVALALLAAALSLWRRDGLVLLALLPAAAAIVAIIPRVSPYAGGKVLAIGSASVVFAAVLGARSLRWRGRPWPGILAAGIALGAVAASDALAYHQVKLAPVERLAAMHGIAERLHVRDVVMGNEAEEFAKNYLAPTRMNSLTEAITPLRPDLVVGVYQSQRFYDLDDQRQPLPYVYGGIVTRRGPGVSRPAADFRRVATSRWYDGWRRDPFVAVVRHLRLQGPILASARPACDEVRALAAGARPGDRLVGAAPPPLVWVDPRVAPRSSAWVSILDKPGRVVPRGPGSFGARRRFAAGTYEVWVAGDFGRRVRVTLDGRTVATAKGIDTLGQWTPAGRVAVGGGVHRLGLERGGGGLAPGDGYEGDIGPVGLARGRSTRLVSRPPPAWRSFCGRRWDWIELVRRVRP